MTANAMAGDREKVMEAGMNDHIAKPLNVGAMFATIAKWIKPASAHIVFSQHADNATKTIALNTMNTRSRGQKDIKASVEPKLTPHSAGLLVLPGIDVKAGMATTMDNEKLFNRLLIKFRDSQGDFADLFALARADADATAPARAAHTLKGTAGNIGAKGVEAAAGELEHACMSGASSTEIDGLLANTLAALHPVIAGLQVLDTVDAPADSAVGGVLDNAKVLAARERLAQMLRDSDADAADAVDELTELVKGTAMAGALRRVATEVADFNFDAALAALQQTGI
jgi:HPt (histidine-containing phosphotransfer) domain-containing protein